MTFSTRRCMYIYIYMYEYVCQSSFLLSLPTILLPTVSFASGPQVGHPAGMDSTFPQKRSFAVRITGIVWSSLAEWQQVLFKMLTVFRACRGPCSPIQLFKGRQSLVQPFEGPYVLLGFCISTVLCPRREIKYPLLGPLKKGRVRQIRMCSMCFLNSFGIENIVCWRFPEVLKSSGSSGKLVGIISTYAGTSPTP